MKKLLDTLLFSNSFYGMAAVALALENNIVLHLPLNHPLFYLLLFCGVTAFYTLSYRYDPHPLQGNKRAVWIAAHKQQLSAYQYLLLALMLAAGARLWLLLPETNTVQLLRYGAMLAAFPFLGLLYYGFSFPGFTAFRLRSFGWFKPFIIGAVWAGTVSFMPWLLYHWMNNQPPVPTLQVVIFMLHNWMFVSVLAILFDIKDYAADHNQSLKTFVVRKGLRYVIYTIVLPLILLGTAVLVAFLLIEENSIPAILLFLAPMFLLGRVALDLSKRRPISWYLLVIDGLMPVKAICGMAAMAFG